MEKLLNLLRRFLTWLDNLFGNLWTGQPGERPQKQAQERQQGIAPPPVTPPTTEQTELQIGSDEPPVYKKRNSILTFRERIFFSSLKKAVSSEYLIMAKVRMGDVVWLENEPKDRKQHVNKTLCKHVDFLLCSRFRLIPVLVIEVDDPSHQWEGRAENDRFKDETFASVGLPILRVKMQDRYDVESLSRQIQELIHSKDYFVQDTDE